MIVIYDNGENYSYHAIYFIRLDDPSLIPVIEKVNINVYYDPEKKEFFFSDNKPFIIATAESLSWRTEDSLMELHDFICPYNFYCTFMDFDSKEYKHIIRTDLIEDKEVIKLLSYLVPLWENEFDETDYDAKENWDRLCELRLIAFKEFKNETNFTI